MLHSTFDSIEDGENLAARALGRPEIRFEWDAVRAVITRYDAGQQAELAGLMQAYLGRNLCPWRQDFTALVGQAGEQAGGIYEADYRDFNRDTYARGRQTFDATYAAFKRLLVAAWRRDELAAGPSREGARLMARRRLTLAPLDDRRCSARGTFPRSDLLDPAQPDRADRPGRRRGRRRRGAGGARRQRRRAPARPAAWCSTSRSTPSPPTT